MSRGEAWLVVPAYGLGVRLGRSGPKAFTPLAGRPLVAYCLEAAAASGAVAAAVLVADPEAARAALAACPPAARGLVLAVVPGGGTRRESVAAGLAAVRAAVGPAADPVVLVHDAARPLAPPELFARVAAAAAGGAAVCARPSPDTVKRVAGDRVAATPPRAELALAQTPQGARLSLLERAHRAWAGGEASDDAALVEALGEPVRAVEGTPLNFKVTAPEDLALAEAWVRAGGAPWLAGGAAAEERGGKMGLRVGLGYDVHPFAAGRALVLGGVAIPHEVGLAGHSDADAVCHALADALLGALALGDLGRHFPDSDPRWQGADSVDLLRRVVALLAERGARPVSVDVTVVTEAPRLAPHVVAMRDRLAPALGVGRDRISIKATRPEGLGALGQGRGLAAMAVALVAAPD